MSWFARGIEQSAVYLATLRDGRAVDPVLLMKNATAARYTPAGGGRLLFVRNDNLYAQTLNRTARKLEGEPELVQQRVASSPAFHVAHFSVSRTGVVAWRPGTAGLSQVTIFDRQGREIGTAGSPTVVQTLKLAPDETRLLIGFNGTAWLLEPGRPGQQQLEQGALDTLWSSDGSKLLDGIPTDGGKSHQRCGTSGDRRRGGSRTGEGGLEWGVLKTSLPTARRCCSVAAPWIRRCSRLSWRRAERAQSPGSDGRDDFAHALLAGRTMDCVHRLLRGGGPGGSTAAEEPTCSRTQDLACRSR